MSSDQELIIQFQQSINREANFTSLLHKHQQKVYYQIKRMVLDHADADDIAQLVWIKIWNKLDGFKMESEFTTWLFRIAYNETLNYIQKQQKQRNTLTNNDLLDYENATASSDSPKSTEIQIGLDRAISQLPEKQKVVFMLRYYDGFDYEKIATIVGTTIGGAKANYHQAVKKVEGFIKKL
jgi:RNA polymerase sigma-70 factor (ECF subfamily)